MRPSRIPLPVPLRSTPVTALRRYYEHSDSCAGGSSAPVSMNTVLVPAQVSLRPVPRRRDHSISTHLTRPAIAFARYPSAVSVSCPRQVEISPFPSWLITRARPYRVRYPMDWSLPVDCSLHHLTMTQFPLGTGRRASTWRGLAPLCRGTIAGALGLAATRLVGWLGKGGSLRAPEARALRRAKPEPDERRKARAPGGGGCRRPDPFQ